MALVVIVLVVLFASRGVHAHPRFPKTDDSEIFRKEPCSSQHNRLRNDVIEKSKCGDPKEVFTELKVQASYFQVIPSAVWVKRCVGLCDFEAAGSKCVATKTKIEHVPVRIYNLKTNKEMCSTYPVEVHESCGCCAVGAGDCAAPRVYNPPEPEYEVESV